MRKFLLFLLCSVFLFSNKIEVTANTVDANGTNKIVRFFGNVYIFQDVHNWMKADRAIVYFDENNQTKKYVASGHASFEMQDGKGHYRGSADNFTNIVQESIYIMAGDAKVWDLTNKRFLSGDRVNVDMKNSYAKVKSDTQKPVKFIFELQNKGKK